MKENYTPYLRAVEWARQHGFLNLKHYVEHLADTIQIPIDSARYLCYGEGYEQIEWWEDACREYKRIHKGGGK